MIPDSEDTQKRRVFSIKISQKPWSLMKSRRECYFVNKEYLRPFSQGIAVRREARHCICTVFVRLCICTVFVNCVFLLYLCGALDLKWPVLHWSTFIEERLLSERLYKWNLGHNRSFVCLIQCKLFELRYKSSLCVWGALYLWTSFLDQNGFCTRTHKVFGVWWSQVHRLVWEPRHRLGLARLGNQTCGQGGWNRKQT